MNHIFSFVIWMLIDEIINSTNSILMYYFILIYFMTTLYFDVESIWLVKRAVNVSRLLSPPHYADAL